MPAMNSAFPSPKSGCKTIGLDSKNYIAAPQGVPKFEKGILEHGRPRVYNCPARTSDIVRCVLTLIPASPISLAPALSQPLSKERTMLGAGASRNIEMIAPSTNATITDRRTQAEAHTTILVTIWPLFLSVLSTEGRGFYRPHLSTYWNGRF
jgi:hypothetical protein